MANIKNTLKQLFSTGSKPTGTDFAKFIDLSVIDCIKFIQDVNYVYLIVYSKEGYMCYAIRIPSTDNSEHLVFLNTVTEGKQFNITRDSSDAETVSVLTDYCGLAYPELHTTSPSGTGSESESEPETGEENESETETETETEKQG